MSATAIPDFVERAHNATPAEAEVLLAIADTKLVLGNWYIACLFNGKSLPDYAALLSMTGASFGHARALYNYLSALGPSYTWLERGRGADAIHSLGMLDKAPSHWQDFVATLYLAEQATWLRASYFLDHDDRTLSALARRIGEESYFHLKYATGWAQELANTPDIAARTRDALLARYAHALAWFPAGPGKDIGGRDDALALEKAAREFLDLLGLGDEPLPLADHHVHPADGPLTRQQPLPAGLYERVRFKDSDAAP